MIFNIIIGSALLSQGLVDLASIPHTEPRMVWFTLFCGIFTTISGSIITLRGLL